jgi:hypothetical protein
MGFYGTFEITINADGTIEINEGDNFYVIHGYLMWFAWGVLGLLQIVSMRYIK